jgi:hypothetical protein
MSISPAQSYRPFAHINTFKSAVHSEIVVFYR